MANLTVSRESVRSDVLQAARDFVSTSSLNKSYVAYPVTSYQMNVVIGEWDFTTYDFTDCEIYAISYVPANGGVSGYMRFSRQSARESGHLDNPYSVLTYSSASHSMQLVDKGGIKLETVLVFGVILLTCWLIVRDIFSNVSRH